MDIPYGVLALMEMKRRSEANLKVPDLEPHPPPEPSEPRSMWRSFLTKRHLLFKRPTLSR